VLDPDLAEELPRHDRRAGLGREARQLQRDRLHHSSYQHPLVDAVDEASKLKLTVGPFPTGGGPYTPNRFTFRPNDFRPTNNPMVPYDAGGQPVR
jgi:hypothetical protein